VKANSLSENDCPSIQALQSAQLDRAASLKDEYTWIGVRYSKFDTKRNWMFVMHLGGRRYSNEKEALEESKNDFQFMRLSDSANNVKDLCLYEGIFGATMAYAVPVSAIITTDLKKA
jgi:hypothetical protein